MCKNIQEKQSAVYQKKKNSREVSFLFLGNYSFSQLGEKDNGGRFTVVTIQFHEQHLLVEWDSSVSCCVMGLQVCVAWMSNVCFQ